MKKLLTDKEQAALDKLSEAWNAFVKLKVIHPDDQNEFRNAIHVAQNIIMSRPVFKQLREDQ